MPKVDWEATERYLQSLGRESGVIIGSDEIPIEAYQDEPDYSHLLKGPETYRDKVLALFYPDGSAPVSGLLPWGKTHGNIVLRPGEVSIWNGANGSGKSLLLGQVMLSQVKQGDSVVVASMEMRPERTLHRMVRQLSGAVEPRVSMIDKALLWMSGKVRIYEHLGMVKPKQMIAVARYCATHGVKHVVVDSLLKCGIREDDLDGQKNFVDELCSLGKSSPVHVHLVTHTRKGEDDRRVYGKHDIRGAGAISDQVDNVFNVWRNRGKEMALNKGGLTAEEERELVLKPDAMILMDKHRNGEWEGTIPLWVDRPSMQFVAERGRGHMPFMEDE